jgi:GDP-L-fucose synthase
MPTNLYGPGDNFDAEGGHLVPMLMRRFAEAHKRGDSKVTVWGTGTPRRELLHVDDLADACLFLLERETAAPLINIGTGTDNTVAEIATLVRDLVHRDAEITFDPSRPDGMPRKLLDVSRVQALGWHHAIDLNDGLQRTWDWYRDAPEVRGEPRRPAA